MASIFHRSSFFGLCVLAGCLTVVRSESTECKDVNPDCGRIDSSHCDENSVYSFYMHKFCQKTCNACPIAAVQPTDDIPSTSVNVDSEESPEHRNQGNSGKSGKDRSPDDKLDFFSNFIPHSHGKKSKKGKGTKVGKSKVFKSKGGIIPPGFRDDADDRNSGSGSGEGLNDELGGKGVPKSGELRSSEVFSSNEQNSNAPITIIFGTSMLIIGIASIIYRRSVRLNPYTHIEVEPKIDYGAIAKL